MKQTSKHCMCQPLLQPSHISMQPAPSGLPQLSQGVSSSTETSSSLSESEGSTCSALICRSDLDGLVLSCSAIASQIAPMSGQEARIEQTNDRWISHVLPVLGRVEIGVSMWPADGNKVACPTRTGPDSGSASAPPPTTSIPLSMSRGV